VDAARSVRGRDGDRDARARSSRHSSGASGPRRRRVVERLSGAVGHDVETARPPPRPRPRPARCPGGRSARRGELPGGSARAPRVAEDALAHDLERERPLEAGTAKRGKPRPWTRDRARGRPRSLLRARAELLERARHELVRRVRVARELDRDEAGETRRGGARRAFPRSLGDCRARPRRTAGGRGRRAGSPRGAPRRARSRARGSPARRGLRPGPRRRGESRRARGPGSRRRRRFARMALHAARVAGSWPGSGSRASATFRLLRALAHPLDRFLEEEPLRRDGDGRVAAPRRT